MLVAGLIAGFGAISLAGSIRSPIDIWLPDLATGIALAIAGSLAKLADRSSRVGDIIHLAAVAWFLPNFVVGGPPPLAWLAPQVVFVHRAALVHAIVAFPGGRIRRPAEWVLVGVAYLTSLGDLLRDERLAILWAAAALIGVWGMVVTRHGPTRQAGIRALPAMALLALVLGATNVAILAIGRYPPPILIVHAYEAGIAAVGAALVLAVLEVRARRQRIADAAVEVTLGPAGYVRELLAESLRDPTVQVAFAIDDGELGGWVDELGRPIEPLQASGSRSVIPIVVDERAVAHVACDPLVLADPDLRPAIETAARLAASNVRLRAGLRAEAARIEASRRRLLSAGDEQRMALVRQLDHGAGATLAELRRVLDEIPAEADPAVRAAVERSSARIVELDLGLRSLSAGLGPSDVRSGGLSDALARIADGTDVRLVVQQEADLPYRSATATYFVCAEAIANALKHAGASTITVTVGETAGRVRIEITDDGRGGASIDTGSGLRGLSDRVAALGGALSVSSPAGTGTRISAEFPIT